MGMSETGAGPGLYEAREQDKWNHLFGVSGGDGDLEGGDHGGGDADTSGKRPRLE